jgi:4a-hydroxytetrahydrobiopterin dehydratase
MSGKLSKEERAEALKGLPGWSEAEDGAAITRRFVFADFSEAFGFMTRAALEAQKMDHHPDWTNAYKTVDVRLSSHDVGGVSERDIALARAMNRLAGR